MTGVERGRVESFGHPEDGLFESTPWYHWGPYLAERAWGTVREDYSEHGTAWDYFPHDHARSRAYRWNEDGMAGICDDRQTFCFALALWNGKDPILKERMFGLTGGEGNHGEDAKEYWWYLDSTPTPLLDALALPLPAGRVPVRRPGGRATARRGRDEPEYELVDTGRLRRRPVLGGRPSTTPRRPERPVHGGHASPTAGPSGDPARAATLWFRNTWAWGLPAPARPDAAGHGADRLAGRPPQSRPAAGRSTRRRRAAEPLFCDNETNAAAALGLPGRSPYPKDGINDHVVHGAATVNPDGDGHQGARCTTC